MRTPACLLLVIGLFAMYSAARSSSPVDIPQPAGRPMAGPFGNTVLLIVPIKDCVMDQVLSDLGVSYDRWSSPYFVTVDLTPYEHVIVALDGPAIEEPSIAHVAAWARAGGYLHFYGGTEYELYALALDVHLLRNDVKNFAWAESAQPHATITNGAHYLAAGLPAVYNFEDTEASYYQTRSNDPAVSVAARNGDGYDLLISKVVGQGSFDICVNSPTDKYYWWPSDYEWCRQVVANMLACGGSTPTESATWGRVKMLFR